MTLIPDVPVVVLGFHIVALVTLLTHGLITSWQRLMLLRQNGAEPQDLLEA